MFCRIRPYLDQQDSAWTTTLPDSPLLPLTVEDPERVSINLPDKSRTFDFDKVFDADATQGIPFPPLKGSILLYTSPFHLVVPLSTYMQYNRYCLLASITASYLTAGWIQCCHYGLRPNWLWQDLYNGVHPHLLYITQP